MPPKGMGYVEAEHASWLWNVGKPPKWLAKQTARIPSGGKPGRSGGYVAGKSCGAGAHEWEDRGTYMKCMKCKATRSIRGVRSKVENL